MQLDMKVGPMSISNTMGFAQLPGPILFSLSYLTLDKLILKEALEGKY